MQIEKSKLVIRNIFRNAAARQYRYKNPGTAEAPDSNLCLIKGGDS